MREPAGAVRVRAVAGVAVLALVALLSTPGLTDSGNADGHGPEGRLASGQVVGVSVLPFGSNRSANSSASMMPLVEVFTATWCPPCAPADRALDRLLVERSPGLDRDAQPDAGIGLAVLAYHPVPDPGGEDPYGVPEGVDRLTRKHGAFWFPSVYVQGVLEDAPQTRDRSVDAGMEQLAYNSYSNLINRAAAMEQLFLIRSTGPVVADGNVTLEVTFEALTSSKQVLYAQAVLWEDDLFFPGSNGVDTHRMTVRALSERRIEPDGVESGDTFRASWSIPVPPGVNTSAAGVTIFVEAAWDVPARDDSGRVMALAGATAAAAATLVFFMRRRPSRSRMTPARERAP